MSRKVHAFIEGDDLVLRIPRPLAQEIEATMADLLCWCRGFECAYEGSNGPLGLEGTRSFHMHIIHALYPERGMPF